MKIPYTKLSGLVLVYFMSVFIVQAQTPFFKSGLLMGVNGSQITGDNMVGFDKGGILIGPFVEHEFSDISTLRMELLFSMKGSADAKSKPDPNRNWDLYRVNYLEVPILFDYHVYQKFGLNGGLAVGVNIGEYYIDVYKSEYPDFSLAKKIEYSYLIGGYYEHNAKMEFFIRYQSSIINFSTANNTPFFQLWGQRRPGYLNVLASFGLRYYFGQK
ncbi:MAG: outer membrane beta-barrel protein [Bacteroidetes bacterium]|nr:outer membrane beta-barrel protein [Bacteroidota bacterium]